MIPFNKASITDREIEHVVDAMKNSILSGDGKYTAKVYEKFKDILGIENMLLTTSGTAALEMASLLIELEEGDEVIVPSFTFSSTVNAFMLRGSKPVFCDIRRDTMNIDETKIEDLITNKTKAIYVVDYAGVPCEMDVINDIAKRHNLHVIEDSAQAVGSTYKGRSAGTLSELGCYSFHETKNYVMGEGGAIVINDTSYLDRAEILREKGKHHPRIHFVSPFRVQPFLFSAHLTGSSYLRSCTVPYYGLEKQLLPSTYGSPPPAILPPLPSPFQRSRDAACRLLPFLPK